MPKNKKKIHSLFFDQTHNIRKFNMVKVLVTLVLKSYNLVILQSPLCNKQASIPNK